MSEPRDVKPFVGGLTVPYFLDIRMVKQVMAERGCTKAEARDALAKLWKGAKGHGH